MRYRPRCSHCRRVVHTQSASLSRTATDPHLRSHLKSKSNEEPSERLRMGHGLKVRGCTPLRQQRMAEEREGGNGSGGGSKRSLLTRPMVVANTFFRWNSRIAPTTMDCWERTRGGGSGAGGEGLEGRAGEPSSSSVPMRNVERVCMPEGRRWAGALTCMQRQASRRLGKRATSQRRQAGRRKLSQRTCRRYVSKAGTHPAGKPERVGVCATGATRPREG